MGPFVRVLVVDDEKVVRTTVGDYLRDLGHQVDYAENGIEAIKIVQASNYELAFIDVRMPKMDGLTLLAKLLEFRPEILPIIMTGHANMETAIEALRLGAVDFLIKPIDLLNLEATLEKALQVRQLIQDRRHLRETIRGLQSSENQRGRNRTFVGRSPAAKKIRDQIAECARAGCDTVLLTGETGVGKEVVARGIHFAAAGEDKPFIAVSCPALPDTLLESELFGHVKGSFTGATIDKAGFFELANGGTLFLDEVADLSIAAQADLLRVLETRSFRRVGGDKEITVAVRVIVATNAPLKNLAEQGKFRRDLFYRLNSYEIEIPLLRERREDIVQIAEHFLSTFIETRGLPRKRLSPEVMETLTNYPFPGNARELRNLVERAAILSPSELIMPEHCPLPRDSKPQVFEIPEAIPDNSERAQILEALNKTKWNRRETATLLGIPYSSLRYKMLRLRITRQ